MTVLNGTTAVAVEAQSDLFAINSQARHALWWGVKLA